jgi:hypothetical protein
VCVPGLAIKQIASTGDVERVMASASAQQHASASHLVLTVYMASKAHATGAHPALPVAPSCWAHACRSAQCH